MNLFEVKSAGIFNSQLFRGGTKISEPRTTTLFEFELPIENGGVSFIDNDSAPITQNTVICAKAGQKRHTKFPFKCYYFHIIIYDKELSDTAAALPNFIKIDNTEKYTRIFKSIIKHSNSKSENDKLLLYSHFLKLISLLTEKTQATKSTGGSVMFNNYIEMAIGYIDEHLSEKLTLENVAGAVSLSPIYFHGVFKAATGQTLHDFIEEKRIRKSITLMQTTDLTLVQIAYCCGFSSQSYFSYAFKRKMKTTPRNYIRLLNANYDI